MAFWVWIDDSLLFPELVAGGVVAAVGATMAEVVQYQADSHIRIRAEWVAAALRLPWSILGDTVIVLRALWRAVARGEQPPSGFVGVPRPYGDDTAEGATRRALLLGAMSAAPNKYALGLDERRQALVVHYLVLPDGERGAATPDPAPGEQDRELS